ncbi:condensin II non structural maintenance of chromosomes subunit-domain-containing protein [Dunaliella salina]|uniref:Condensin II non structural maintenance of chromosomes subunit-domain-containing protein n=1 Tax=Dunaliella salina TaxID=3046 RepID=A0ABQ7GF35_DUNSA|nr:condensin II non structural maintenance of chromosomes subunit-domain-containing protein [Dunaliella salina]|eukprot:KAF5833222.1 condensin II non structural maintenance of chromosomes subunit-domain-containing protein [Dunaliella salina]
MGKPKATGDDEIALWPAVQKGNLGELLSRVATGRVPAVLGESIKELTRKQLQDVCSMLELRLSESIQLALNPAQPQTDEEQAAIEGQLALEDLPEVQDPVVKLCCSWWELKAPGRENFVPQSLPYLLVRANTSGRAMDVKACYSMREGFTMLDFEDPCIEDIKRLLLQSAMHPGFLHKPEGRKFVACIFGMDISLVSDLTAVIKNQIPSGRKSALDAYGEIIFRAWKDSVGSATQFEIENTCILFLMQAALVAASPPLNAALRQVLNGLHSQKRVAGVDAMLLRLYRPILFRALTAANAAVRRNSLLVLLDAFPLRDPDTDAEEQDELMTQQFAALSECMADECPLVRAAAVAGAAQVLNKYWEIIPAAATATFVAKLTGDLAYDMSWPSVRVAVLEGLTLLVDNPHAQPVLKRALPQLAALLGDPSLKVREAMASLLAAVQRTRVIHFYDVVPLEGLLAVMASDAPSVSHKVQQVLVPTYFPNPQEGSEGLVSGASGCDDPECQAEETDVWLMASDAPSVSHKVQQVLVPTYFSNP